LICLVSKHLGCARSCEICSAGIFFWTLSTCPGMHCQRLHQRQLT
jgi:hypothetical protein